MLTRFCNIPDTLDNVPRPTISKGSGNVFGVVNRASVAGLTVLVEPAEIASRNVGSLNIASTTYVVTRR